MNGAAYYYEKNAQGDVIGIWHQNGTKIANYTYDAWGNITSIKNQYGEDVSSQPRHQANLNPIRYRGYYYDVELKMYWLTTRFYDPAIGRFINADTQLNDGMLGNNLYAYCGNDPVNGHDPTGTCTHNTMGFDCSACREAKIGLAINKDILSVLGNEYGIVDNGGNMVFNVDPDMWYLFHFYYISEGRPVAGKINVGFNPTADNPYFEIKNSWLYTEQVDQAIILAYVMLSPYYSQEVYGRTLSSMITEWKAHNFAFTPGAVFPAARSISFIGRAQHLNADRANEGRGFFETIFSAAFSKK